jgi:hypothetical protein
VRKEKQKETLSLSKTGFSIAARLSKVQMCPPMVLSSSLWRYVTCCLRVNSCSCKSYAYSLLRAFLTA